MGMAGNVNKNLLKADPSLEVEILSSPGWDKARKIRYVDDRTNHMFIRVDENDNIFSRFVVENIEYDHYDAIIISDYDKGCLSEEDISYISLNHSLTFLDTKKRLGEWAQNITYIKLNTHETKVNVSSDMKELLKEKLITTLGPQGCEHNGKQYKGERVPVKDVAGAGDTFLAFLVAAYLQTHDIDYAISQANDAATKVVQQRGVGVPQ